MNPPKDFAELFDFYQNQVKVFYSAVQAENTLPLEILFELNAAFDHVSRHYVYGEPEHEVVLKSYSHLKRACLDVFKITLRETLDMADELAKIDVSLIDNGAYEKQLKTLLHQIKVGARDARRLEGDPMSASPDITVPAFGRWLPVYENCLRLQEEFYEHSAVDWAKTKGRWMSTKSLVGSAIITTVFGFGLNELLRFLLS